MPGVCAFTARTVTYERDEELNYEVLTLAESPQGDKRVLMIQRRLRFDDQDAELGQDTFSLVDEGGRTHYGGVTDWTCTDEKLAMTLDADAADALGCSRFDIQLTADGGRIGVLLQRLMG